MRNRDKNLSLLYFLGFFLAVSSAFYAYIQSSFIKELVGMEWVGWFFIIAMAIALIVVLFFPRLIIKFSNYRLAIIVLILKLFALIGLILFNSPYLLLLFFILLMITSTLVWINLDVFLESFTLNKTTGRTRGTYFTVLDLGWVITPLLLGYLVGNNNYRLAFLASALLALFVLMVVLSKRKQLKSRRKYENHRIQRAIRYVLKNRNFRSIFGTAFLLQLFFTSIAIYMPIYLNAYLGFSWPSIGIMFSIALLPYVLLQIPAGIVADKYIGEKEILGTGFLILIASLFLFFFTKSTSAVVWTLILFLSRCGASLVQVMRETYFFKIVDVENVDYINLLRASKPLAYIIGALLGTIIVAFYSISYIFIVLGIILLSGLYFTYRLKDTK